MKCPTCGKPGYKKPPMGRPKLTDDAEVRRLRAKGLSLRDVGAKLGISLGAVQASLKRSR